MEMEISSRKKDKTDFRFCGKIESPVGCRDYFRVSIIASCLEEARSLFVRFVDINTSFQQIYQPYEILNLLKAALEADVEVPTSNDLVIFQRGRTVADPDFSEVFEMGNWIWRHEPDKMLMPSNGCLDRMVRVLKG